MRFEELRLLEPIVRAVASEGYTAPTPIQVKAIPEVLAGRDLLGCAQTGTGKTGAFAMPILQRLSAPREARPDARREGHRGRGDGSGRLPRALVLCPTRELAAQIAERFSAYGRNLSVRHALIFGGVGQDPQVRAMRAGTDVVIATPGRLLDLIEQGHVDLRAIEILVLDEADRMLDMGFIRDIRRIVKILPQQRQTLLFSATMPPEIRELAESILRSPAFVQVDRSGSTVDAIAQSVHFVAGSNKTTLLERLLRSGRMDRTLVFTRTKHRADKVARALGKSGIVARAIHGNKSQSARTRALDDFRAGAPAVLVATDIAARGLDVDGITHVVNYDLPDVAETYVHRIGRTARAGASGSAVSFCDREERDSLRAIERLIGMQIEASAESADLAHGASEPRSGGGHRRSRDSAPRRGDRGHRPQRSGSGAPRRSMEAAPAPAPSRPLGIQQRGRRPLGSGKGGRRSSR
jgi:ATP-dependent RNA helicase RhlE